MRQGQQNRRGRGRSSNNNNNNNSSNSRKSQNPLTRSFESAGPDVKLRGTPSHIAEKYISLARDALSSGDPVLAENFLQHAEHYNRIILTFREQQMSQGGSDPYQNGARTHSLNSQDPDGEDFGDDEGSGDDLGGNQPQAGQPDQSLQGEQPAPPQQQRFDNRPQRFDNRGEHRHNNQNRQDNNRQDNRQDRNPRGGENRFDSRGPGPDRGPDRGNDRAPDRGNDRNDRPDRFGGGDRDNRGFREDRNGQGQSADGNGGFRRRERFQNDGNNGAHGGANGYDRPQPSVAPPVPQPPPAAAAPPSVEEQPAFLRRPVRRPRREEPEVVTPRQPEPESQD